MARNNYTTDAARLLGFRSGFESDLSKDLEEKGLWFEYESKLCKFNYTTPIKKGECVDCKGEAVIQNHTYTCDFVLEKKDGSLMFVETKGRLVSKDRTKHKYIKEQHPDVDLRILFSYNGKATPKMFFLDWAKSLGIPAATVVKPTKTRKGRYLPLEWLEEIIDGGL